MKAVTQAKSPACHLILFGLLSAQLTSPLSVKHSWLFCVRFFGLGWWGGVRCGGRGCLSLIYFAELFFINTELILCQEIPLMFLIYARECN